MASQEKPKFVVVDTTTILYLNRVGHINLLKENYGNIYVPSEVFGELKDGEKKDEKKKIVEDMKREKWIKELEREHQEPRSPNHLGKGEWAVINSRTRLVDAQSDSEILLIIDEQLARKYVKEETKYKLTGTVGVLLKAMKEGYIERIVPILRTMISSGWYCSDKFLKDVSCLENEVSRERQQKQTQLRVERLLPASSPTELQTKPPKGRLWNGNGFISVQKSPQTPLRVKGKHVLCEKVEFKITGCTGKGGAVCPKPGSGTINAKSRPLKLGGQPVLTIEDKGWCKGILVLPNSTSIPCICQVGFKSG